MPNPKTWMSEEDNMPTKPTYTLPLPTPIPWTHTNASGKYRGAVWIKSNGKFIGKTYSHEGEDAIANAAFIVTACNAYQKNLEIIADLLRALKAQIQMRDTTKPTKLQAALCWRDNDDIANKLAQEAIAKAEGK